jgi:arginyl-tRNA--protein-N-Asp/Glu arginylyltransferase
MQSRLPRLADVPVSLIATPAQPCPYFSNRTAMMLYWPSQAPGGSAYQQLMDWGFRRTGNIAYTTGCQDCLSCVPIRVPVNEFRPSRSQRRACSKNADVRVEFNTPTSDRVRLDVYSRYLAEQHGRCDPPDVLEYTRLFVSGPAGKLEMSYWVDDRLVGVGIVDETPLALSSLYFYYDPPERARSLGVFSALCEIEECRKRGLLYWYAGYYVRGCRKMEYKAEYQPHEFLHPDAVWRREFPEPVACAPGGR